MSNVNFQAGDFASGIMTPQIYKTLVDNKQGLSASAEIAATETSSTKRNILLGASVVAATVVAGLLLKKKFKIPSKQDIKQQPCAQEFVNELNRELKGKIEIEVNDRKSSELQKPVDYYRGQEISFQRKMDEVKGEVKKITKNLDGETQIEVNDKKSSELQKPADYYRGQEMYVQKRIKDGKGLVKILNKNLDGKMKIEINDKKSPELEKLENYFLVEKLGINDELDECGEWLREYTMKLIYDSGKCDDVEVLNEFAHLYWWTKNDLKGLLCGDPNIYKIVKDHYMVGSSKFKYEKTKNILDDIGGKTGRKCDDVRYAIDEYVSTYPEGYFKSVDKYVYTNGKIVHIVKDSNDFCIDSDGNMLTKAKRIKTQPLQNSYECKRNYETDEVYAYA